MTKFLQPLHGLTSMTLELGGEKYEGQLMASRYVSSGALALYFADEQEDELITTISCSLDVNPSGHNRFWLKNWSENSGIEVFLRMYDIAIPTGRSRPSGFIRAEEWELTPGFTTQLIEENSNETAE
jgi:hypothetical protein